VGHRPHQRGAGDVRAVRISLFLDGGLTFPHVLADRTPNDGTETVRLPVVGTSKARIRIEAAGNVFFGLSDTDFTVQPPPARTAAFPLTLHENGRNTTRT